MLRHHRDFFAIAIAGQHSFDLPAVFTCLVTSLCL